MNSTRSIGYLSEKSLDFYSIADIRNNSRKSMDLKLLKKKKVCNNILITLAKIIKSINFKEKTN